MSKSPYISEIHHAERRKIRRAAAVLAVSGIMAGFFMLSLAGLGPLLSSAASGTTYNNVQVSLQTQNSTDNYFAIDVYNSTGGLVASSQSQFPAFSFELPSGSYIFTASSLYSSRSYSLYWGSQDMEYGYQSQQISSSSSFSIVTKPLSQISSTKVSVQVKFENGTAVAGASVSAQALGSYYYWGNNFAMWNQTNSDGVATLTVPNVPVMVSSWDWVPVNIPTSETTYHTTVGGQPINVTVYWQPMYVTLSGSQLVVPPQSSAQITLAYTPQQNYCYPLAAANTFAKGAPSGAMSNGGSTSGSSAAPSIAGASIVPCYFYGAAASSQSQDGVLSGSPSPQAGPSTGVISPALLPAGQNQQSSVGSAENVNPVSTTSLGATEIAIIGGIAAIVSAVGLLALLAVRRAQRHKGLV